jgi:hypothetical protein
LDVICEGDALSMGIRQGEAWRDKLQLIEPLLPQLVALRLAQPRWLPFRPLGSKLRLGSRSPLCACFEAEYTGY